MNQFRNSFRWAWSILVICTLAFAMGGCEGDDGSDGRDGATGAQGPQGEQGPQGDQGEQGEGLNPVDQALAMANVESCEICHGGAGGYHQATYDQAFDTEYALTLGEITSTGDAAPFTLEIDFNVTYMGAPYNTDPATDAAFVDGLFFAISQWSDTSGMFERPGTPFSEFSGITGDVTSDAPGSFTLTASVGYDVDSFDSGAIVGKLALNEITDQWPDAPTSHFHAYDDLTLDAVNVGTGALADDYSSLANVEGCEACHGTPYRKHANVQAAVEGAPDFTYCKSCHFDDRVGGHFEWQYEADDPYGWATDAAMTEDYSYTANVMNVTHMSHAMHLPYPMSMSNCVTCHDGNLTSVLDDDFFTPETCKSCHVVNGIDAWPAGDVTGDAGKYYRTARAPALEYLWIEAGVDTFHDGSLTGCTQCHGDVAGGFADYHSGYDKTVYTAAGTRYTDLAGIKIDDITIAGDLITVDFSAVETNVVPTMAISFYGWDSKHHIIPGHERDGNRVDDACMGFRPGCNIEWSPGSTKPFFTEDAASVAGDWRVTFDMSLFQAYKTDPIPTLIADGVVTHAEVTILPRLTVGGVAVNVDAVTTSFELGTSLIKDDYFQGTANTVDIDKCGLCHENTGVLVHRGSGRYGDSVQACKVCHNPTEDGSHMEMQSRSIDAYVHAIHMFQPFDEDDVYNFDPPATEPDPVEVKWNENHKHHAFPNFTTLSCEGCHVTSNDDADAGPLVPVTYNVSDQSKSMPGKQSSSWDFDDPTIRAIGTVPEAVQGAASRACGSCHRAAMIKHDEAGHLAAFDAHTATFGTLVENDPTDYDDGAEPTDGLHEEPVLFGVIDKIMSLFE